MIERPFSKVATTLWGSRRFRGLSDQAKVGYVYLLTNKHGNSIGCYELPDGYFCTDVGCSLDELEAMREELLAAGLIEYDAETDCYLILRWMKHNPLQNSDHAAGARKRLDALPAGRLKELVLAEFEAAQADLDDRLSSAAARKADAETKRAMRATRGDGESKQSLEAHSARLLESLNARTRSRAVA